MTSQCRSDLIFGLFWRMAFQSKLWFSARSHSCLESFPGSGSKARRRGPTSWCWRPWLTWPTWRCRCRWRRRRRSSTTTTSAGSRTTTSATTPCLKNKSLRLEKRKVTIRDELSPFQKVFVFPLLFFFFLLPWWVREAVTARWLEPLINWPFERLWAHTSKAPNVEKKWCQVCDIDALIQQNLTSKYVSKVVFLWEETYTSLTSPKLTQNDLAYAMFGFWHLSTYIKVKFDIGYFRCMRSWQFEISQYIHIS